MPLFRRKSRCPYCGVILDKKPTRARKCPSCRERIRVRRGNLLTEAQLATVDREEKEQAYIERWLRSLSNFDIDQSGFERERRKLSRKFSTRASSSDTLWSLLNRLPGRFKKPRDWRDLSEVYHLQARFLHEEGRDPKSALREAHKWTLRKYQRSELRMKVKIFTANDNHVCPHCRALQGRVFTIKTALREMPIPTLCESEAGMCRCHYSGIVDV